MKNETHWRMRTALGIILGLTSAVAASAFFWNKFGKFSNQSNTRSVISTGCPHADLSGWFKNILSIEPEYTDTFEFLFKSTGRSNFFSASQTQQKTPALTDNWRSFSASFSGRMSVHTFLKSELNLPDSGRAYVLFELEQLQEKLPFETLNVSENSDPTSAKTEAALAEIDSHGLISKIYFSNQTSRIRKNQVRALFSHLNANDRTLNCTQWTAVQNSEMVSIPAEYRVVSSTEDQIRIERSEKI